MKIKPEDYNKLKDAIAKIPKANLTAHREALRQDPNVKDLDKRLRWDCLYAATNVSEITHLYDYINDDHIDSALKKIMRELNL